VLLGSGRVSARIYDAYQNYATTASDIELAGNTGTFQETCDYLFKNTDSSLAETTITNCGVLATTALDSYVESSGENTCTPNFLLSSVTTAFRQLPITHSLTKLAVTAYNKILSSSKTTSVEKQTVANAVAALERIKTDMLVLTDTTRDLVITVLN
jgi:hypothetical protein